ncbi:MAG TPA: hypothetical protein VMM81_01840 [Acidimicrobiia bacterium]|nr:hypothetical protein [Acidimicrobiia bacterium]
MSRLAVALLFGIAVGCSGGTPDTSIPGATETTGTSGIPSTTGAVPDDPGCRVAVSGFEERTWDGADEPGTFTSDHWWSEEDLRDAYAEIAIQGDPTFEELRAEGYPVLTFFLLRCIGPEGDVVAISVSELTVAESIPMGAASYLITGGEHLPGHTPAGEFEATYVPWSETQWAQVGVGELVIDSWTAEEITGTFAFTAEERFSGGGDSVEVTGAFRLTCIGSGACG